MNQMFFRNARMMLFKPKDGSTPPEPAGHAETIFTFTGNRIVRKNMSELQDSVWLITRTDDYVFDYMNSDYDGGDNLYDYELVSVDVGSSVENIGQGVLNHCSSLTSVTFQGKTLAQVQEMDNYPWGLDQSIINVA